MTIDVNVSDRSVARSKQALRTRIVADKGDNNAIVPKLILDHLHVFIVWKGSAPDRLRKLIFRL